MTDQQTNSGTPGGTPSGGAPGGSEPAGNPSRSFTAARVAQMQERARTDPAYSGNSEQPARPAPAAADVRGQQQQQPQSPPAERTVDQELAELRAFKAEQDVRKNTLPSGPEKYEARLPADFVLPQGAPRPSFDEQNPALAMARQIAHAEGMSQRGFEKLLGVFASTQIPGQIQQQTQLTRLREANMAQLGVTSHLRVDAVANWVAARAPGDDGLAVANFIRQSGNAQIVRAMESLIKSVSSQRAAADSQQRRENESANADTRIPGYSGMSMVQIRALQMAERMRADPNFARGSRPGYRGER